jgi:hypothetical protein
VASTNGDSVLQPHQFGQQVVLERNQVVEKIRAHAVVRNQAARPAAAVI